MPLWWKGSDKPEIVHLLELSKFIHPEPDNYGNELSIPYSSSATPDKMDGYQWSIENWGTKWGAYDIHLMEEDTVGDGTVCYQFNTAWNPFNYNVSEAMSKPFPSLIFHLNYFERGMGFQGWRRWNSNGVISRGEEHGSLLECNFEHDCMVTSG